LHTWFRLYSELLEDPKVQTLPPDLFKHWINLLCLASKNEGLLPPPADISFALRLSAGTTTDVLSKLLKAGLLERKSGIYQPHNWNKRQYKSDVSTDRVRAFRERFRNVSGLDSETVSAAVSETRSDTDSDTEDRSESNPPIVPPLGDGFEDFWKSYPRKIGKGAAKRVWERIHPVNGLREKIAAAVAEAKMSDQWRRDNGQYIPHPSTWLNQGRWDDEPVSLITETQLREQRYAELERKGIL
jgi:hypothetical protein